MPLRLATFNVKDLFTPSPAKVRYVATLLRQADADVVGLQEIGGADALDSVVSALDGMGYGTPVVGTPDARGIANGLIARVPLRDVRVHAAAALPLPVFVRGDPAPFGARIPLRRGLVHAVVQGVHIVVCHFKSRRPLPLRDEEGRELVPTTSRERGEGELRSLVWRAAEALYLRGLIDEVRARDRGSDVAVLGDMNDVVTSTPVRLLMGDDLVSCADLVPAERRFTVRHGGHTAQIDHVLVTAGLRARLIDARMLNEDLRDPGPFDPDAPPADDSDHAPFVVTFC